MSERERLSEEELRLTANIVARLIADYPTEGHDTGDPTAAKALREIHHICSNLLDQRSRSLDIVAHGAQVQALARLYDAVDDRGNLNQPFDHPDGGTFTSQAEALKCFFPTASDEKIARWTLDAARRKDLASQKINGPLETAIEASARLSPEGKGTSSRATFFRRRQQRVALTRQAIEESDAQFEFWGPKPHGEDPWVTFILRSFAPLTPMSLARGIIAHCEST